MAQDGIIGGWILLSSHLENSTTRERTYPLGPDPTGALLLHPDGRMIAMVTSANTPANNAVSAEQPFKPALAYSGRYRLEPPQRFVTRVDASTLPAWIGTDQARNYFLNGDRLDIVSDPFIAPGGGSEVVAVLSWRRETPDNFTQ